MISRKVDPHAEHIHPLKINLHDSWLPYPLNVAKLHAHCSFFNQQSIIVYGLSSKYFHRRNHMSTIMAIQTMVINHTKNKNTMQQIKITLAVGEVSILHKSMTVTHKTISSNLYHQVVVQHGCIWVFKLLLKKVQFCNTSSTFLAVMASHNIMWMFISLRQNNLLVYNWTGWL
jgi:hypothetical protein